MTNRAFSPTIRSQADLEAAWRRLVGPRSYSGCSIWMMLIQDDIPIPHLTEITEADEPDDVFRTNFGTVLRLLQEDDVRGVRFAFLVSRPGSGLLTAADRGWASALYAVTHSAGVTCEVVHLATKGSIRPIPPDELKSLPTSA